MLWLKVYLLTIPVFFVIDMLWLGFLAKDFYRSQIGFMLRPDVNWLAGVFFYLLFIVGILYFAVAPALDSGGWQKALLSGALLGLVSYAAYDLTNLATVRNWPLLITFVDLAWGTFLTALVALLSYHIALFLQR